MRADGTAGEPSIRGVLRHASAILGRRPVLYVALAVALGVLPDLLAGRAGDALKAVVPASGSGGLGDEFVDLVRALIDAMAQMLQILCGLLLDVETVSTALADAVPARGSRADGSSAIPRIVPPVAAAFLLALTWTSWAPDAALVAGSALISCWVLVPPIAAAEAIRPSALIGRIVALPRGSRWTLARLVAAYLVFYVVLGEFDLDLPNPFEAGTAAAWAVDAVEASLVAGLAVTADAVAVALYVALRRAEDASSAASVAAAFE